MAVSDDILLELWQLALSTELGIVVPCSNQRWLVNNLYRVRRNSGDAELADLTIVTPQDKEEIWICKKPTSLSER